MSLNDLSITTSLDTSQAELQADALEQKVEAQSNAARDHLLRLAGVATIAFTAFGGAVHQSYAIGIQLLVNTMRLHAQVGAAQAALAAGTLNPVAAAQAALTAASIVSLGVALAQFEAGQQEASRQSAALGSLFSAMSLWS